jgi:hypothetical protein
MSWNHKGIEIELSGASFVAQINGKRVASPSLKAAQKAIDKHLAKKAEEVVLNLPVVILRISGGAETIVHASITGIDPEELTVIGLPKSERFSGNKNEEVLPDSPENEALILEFREAKKKYEELEKQIYPRRVPVWINKGYGRNKTTYSEAIQILQRDYDSAVKAEN